MWDEITYPFLNFNGATIEVKQWISNFTLHFTSYVIIYPCKLNHVSERKPRSQSSRSHNTDLIFPEHITSGLKGLTFIHQLSKWIKLGLLQYMGSIWTIPHLQSRLLKFLVMTINHMNHCWLDYRWHLWSINQHVWPPMPSRLGSHLTNKILGLNLKTTIINTMI